MEGLCFDYNNNENSKKIELLGMTFLFYAGSYAIKPILHCIGLASLESVGSLFFYILFGVKLLSILIRRAKLNINLFVKIIICDLLFIVFLLVNSIIFTNTQQYYAEYEMFFRQIIVVFIPCGVILSTVSSCNNAFLFMKKYAKIGSIIMYLSLPLGYLKYWDYQYWGVQLSPFIVILYCNYLDHKNKGDLIFLIIDISLLFWGGRQSLLTVLFVILAIYIFENRKNTKKILIFSLVIIIGILFLVTGVYTDIFKLIDSILGIHMEGLSRAAQGELFSFATRNDIYNYSFRTILQNGSKISGLLSDRFYLRNAGRHTSWIQYPHNIYLELFIDFGMILGAIISIIITTKVIKSILIGDESRRRLGIVICMLTMVRLFVSSSFLIEGNFYILLGFLFSVKKNKIVLGIVDGHRTIY